MCMATLRSQIQPNALYTKTKHMAVVTALEHFCSFSKVENLTYRFLGQLERLCGGDSVNYLSLVIFSDVD